MTPVVLPLGEWNMVESEAGLTRCWVLRERATDPSRPTPESLVLPGVSVGAQVRGCTARLAGVSTAVDLDSRPYLENCTVDASI